MTTRLWIALAPLLAVSGLAGAAPYPTNTCVARKLEAVGNACEVIFHASGGKRPATLANVTRRAGTRLAGAWKKAEDTARKAGVDCAETTGPSDALLATLSDRVRTFAANVTRGQRRRGAAARAKLLTAAGRACRDSLQADADLVANPDADADRSRRNKLVGCARTRLLAAWPCGAGLCPFIYAPDCRASSKPLERATTRVTPEESQAALAALTDAVVFATTVSPNVPTAVTMVPAGPVDYAGRHLEPVCSRGTPYAFFARRGTVNKVFYYFQGGGACFDRFTCSPQIESFDATVGPEDNPGLFTEGFANFSNATNPFRDWNLIFVSYCTGDIHWGDNTVTYTTAPYEAPNQPPVTMHHNGYVNARVVEKWAREHFVNPEAVFVSGSSAGAYGAITGAAYLMENTYRASHFDVVGDAGNGVITQDFLVNNLANWKVDQNTPRWIPELDKPATDLSIDKLWSAVANHYPSQRFGQYTSSYDGGGGGQTFFYQVMRNPGNLLAWLTWWQSSCDWNARMLEIAHATVAAAPNYRYYIGAGSRHTAWGSDKVYADTTGGVTPLVDWVNAMLAGSAAWTNVQCTDCGLLLPDDPRPSPLVPPFEHVDGVDRVVCGG